MNPDNEIIDVECKLTSKRKIKAYRMRQSEAQMQNSLTDGMNKARKEIERGFQLEAGHMGYATSGSGGGGTPTLEREEANQVQINRYRMWAKQCPAKWKGAVLDITAFCFTASESAYQRGVTRQTLMVWVREGLNLYSRIHGWGDQIKGENHE